MTFPRLRFPTFQQVLGLFVAQTSVAAITAGMQRQIDTLRDAVGYHLSKADEHTEFAGFCYGEAAKAENMAEAATKEAAQAERVAGKLAKLLA